MVRCVMFRLDVSRELRSVFGDECEILRADTADELLEAAKLSIDLVCWKADVYCANVPSLCEAVRNSRELCNAANISFSESGKWEKLMLESGNDDFIRLPCDEDVLKIRVKNAVMRKSLVRSAREQMWISFAQKNNALENALFIYEIDITTGKVSLLRSSKAAKEQFYPLSQYAGNKDAFQYYHPDDFGRLLALLSPLSLQRQVKRGVVENEEKYRIKNLKGMWVWVQCKVRFEKDLFGGNRCFNLIQVVDDSDIESDIYKAALKDNVFSVVTVNLDKDVSKQLYVAGSGRQEMPLCYSESYKTYLSRMIVDKDLRRAIHDWSPKVIRNNLENSDRFIDHYSVRLRDGCLRRFSCEMFYFDKQSDIVIIVIKDITKLYELGESNRRQLAEALENAAKANVSKTNFLSVMSHDIRTPMHSIINIAALAREDIGDAEQMKTDLDRIDASARFLLGLVGDILDMSTIESGRLELHPKVCPGDRFAGYIDSLVVPMCTAKGIKFDWDRESFDFPMVVDEIRFNQIFFNILSNAIKYTDNGGTVSLSIDNKTVKDGMISADYVVRDSGCGMSSEFVEKMFLPFRRPDGTEGYTGTGLGLSVTKAIVDKLGGRIKIESKEGEGTAVTVHLRLPVPGGEQLNSCCDLMSCQNNTDDNIRLDGARILVVEDHPVNSEITERMLKKRGAEVECTGDGESAVKLVSDNPPMYYDAVLMDVRMPVMDGIAAAEAIRHIDDRSKADVPIIAMTADAFSDDVKKCLDAGMDGYLAKPLSTATLLSMLAKCLNGGKCRKKKVLVVDDQEVNVAVVRSALEKEYDVIGVNDGKSALKRLKNVKGIIAVITDIQMPNMDGVRLIKEIRSDKSFDGVAIIANTQYGAPSQEAQLLKIGADDFVYKPTTPEIIPVRLKNVLNKYM